MSSTPAKPFSPQLGATARPATRGWVSGWGVWFAALLVTCVAVGLTVYTAVTTGAVASLRADDVAAREAVRTPGADQADGGVNANLVRVPQFALWAPGTLIQATDHYPQPGESFTAQSCTVAFSFSNEEGRNFAVTAGHCGMEGHLVWPTTAETAEDYAREVGRFIYSGLYSPDAPDIDVGIIEITDPDRLMALVGAPIPTGIALGSLKAEDEVCKTGGTTGYTCGAFEETARVQVITSEAGTERETHGDLASVCAAKGDSGGPVFREINGRSAVVGVVSGTEAGRSGETCYEGMDNPVLMSYSNVEQIMQVIDMVVPDALWVEQTW